MFLCGHLETYIHERNYIFTRYPNSSVSPLLLRFWFFGVTPKRIWFMSAYPILSHLGALILVNILDHVLVLTSLQSSPWDMSQALFFICILLSLWIHLFLCFRGYRRSEDSMFVHLVFKYNNSKLCTNIGELLYFL